MTTQLPEISISLKNLYDVDFYMWILATADLLKNSNFSEVDLEHLIEEIESMGRSERQALKSNLRVLLMHLLKWKYQPAKRSTSWLSTINEHRDRLEDTIKDSPSLKPYLAEIFVECYAKARKSASIETELPLITFPTESPFNVEETLNPDYLPN